MNSDTDTDPETEAARFPRRAARAQQTRRALIDAAGALFVERGYVATTIEAIADRAGLARATVFTSVPGGKPELLRQARDLAIAGDTDPIPIPQRAWFLEAMAQTDPRELLRQQAGNYAAILRRAARLECELARAASNDPMLAQLHHTACRQRRHGARLVAARLDELGALHPSLDVAAAADSIYALASPDLYLVLVEDRRWPASDHEQWLARQLRLTILAQ